MVNVFDAVQITVAAEYCARSLGAVAVAPVDVIVTPEPCANDVIPAPMDCTLICCPALKTLGGTVTVMAEALDVVTNLLRSVEARV
jgi:hypothetical protein